MEGKYVAVYRLHGIASLPDDADIQLLSLSEPSGTVTLTTRPADHCFHLDQRTALATTLLNAQVGLVHGDFSTVFAAQLEAAKGGREKHGSGVCLVLSASGELGEPNFSQRVELESFIVCFDAFSRTTLPDKLRPLMNGILAALSLSMQDHYARQVTFLGDATYAIDPASHKPIYSFTFRMSATPMIAGPLDLMTLGAVRRYAEPLTRGDQLERVAALLASSYEVKGSELRSFIEAWAALEIFINSSFRMHYEKEWRARLEAGTPVSARPYFELLARVMKDKIALKDKFLIMASILKESDANEDAATFKTLNSLRNTLHTGQLGGGSLPVQSVQSLLGKYLRLHLDHHGTGSARTSI